MAIIPAKKRILIIEQSPTLRMILFSQLTTAGCLCKQFDSYQLAFTLLHQLSEPPHIIYVAIRSRQIYLDWLKRIKEVCPSAQIVVMVPQEEENHSITTKIVKSTNAFLLKKPFRVDHVLAIAARPVEWKNG